MRRVAYYGHPSPASALAAWVGAYEMWCERRKEHYPDAGNQARRQFGVTLYIDADELRELLDELEPRDGLADTPYLDRLVQDLEQMRTAVGRAPE